MLGEDPLAVFKPALLRATLGIGRGVRAHAAGGHFGRSLAGLVGSAGVAIGARERARGRIRNDAADCPRSRAVANADSFWRARLEDRDAGRGCGAGEANRETKEPRVRAEDVSDSALL